MSSMEMEILFDFHHHVVWAIPNCKKLVQQRRLHLPLLLLLIITFSAGCIVNGAVSLTETEDQVVKRFQSYLQIDTSHPDPDYTAVTKFLIQQGEQIGLHVRVTEFTPKKPVVLLTWKGTDPSLPSVVLNSHTDVVPAEHSKWVHSPFGGHMDEEGKIFARGSQDMKCVGMQYLEAIRNLRAAGFKPTRSIHVVYVPDEEIFGEDGAKKFVQSEEFKELDVAFVLDEGAPSTQDEYRVFYGEKVPWPFVVKATGNPAHGSRMLDGMALQNLRETLNKIDEFRTVQFDKVKSGEAAQEEVISITNVFLNAGTATPTGFVMNMQPSEAEAGFDMRVPPSADTDHLEKLVVQDWAPASRNMTVRFIQKRDVKNKFGQPAVTVADDTNPWWTRLKVGVANAGGNLGDPQILFGCTDARFIRFEGIPAFGFSPMANTPILLHEHNEFLHVTEYLKGITVYEEIIKSFTGPDFEMHKADTDSSST
ncbi:unnamed protein product [Calypogeia fissa]